MTTSNQDAAANLPKATRIFHPYAVKQIEEFSSRGYVRFVYYTSAETAFRILDTKRIWMRNVTCMSDYSEVQHGFNILNGILSKPENRRAFNEALDCCAPGCGEEAISAFNSWWADIRFNNYITCISEHDDSEDQHGRLSMWRAYGGSAWSSRKSTGKRGARSIGCGQRRHARRMIRRQG